MPRKIPSTRPPSGATQDLFAGLSALLLPWFESLITAILSAPALRMDAGDLTDLDKLLQGQLDRVRQANDALKRTAEAQQKAQAAQHVHRSIDAARQQWQGLQERAQAHIEQAAGAVDRFSQQQAAQQIEAAAANKAPITMAGAHSDVLQTHKDTFTRSTSEAVRGIGETALQKAEAEALAAIGRGASKAEIDQILQHRMDVAQGQIAQAVTQRAKVLNLKLTQARAEAAGSDGFEWDHAGHPLKPRPEHVAWHGQRFPWSHDPLPGELDGCGCQARSAWNTQQTG